MDRDVIERKLESLRHCIARVRTKRPPAAESLAADADLQDVLVPSTSDARSGFATSPCTTTKRSTRLGNRLAARR